MLCCATDAWEDAKLHDVIGYCVLIFFGLAFLVLIVGIVCCAIRSLTPLEVRLGQGGEAFVAQELRRVFDRENCIFFDDILLSDIGPMTTQVDHVVLSPFGLFVVETKNINGIVYVTEQPTWVIVRHWNRYRIHNPYRQNYRHLCVLAEVTGLPIRCFTSVVMMVGPECTLRRYTAMYSSLCCDGDDLDEYLKGVRQQALYSQEELTRIAEKIRFATVPDTRENRERHLRYLRNQITLPSEKRAVNNRRWIPANHASAEDLLPTEFADAEWIPVDELELIGELKNPPRV